MAISYKPLWRLLIENDMNKTTLRDELGISSSTLAKMGKNEYVSFEVLDKICTRFKVQPNEVIQWKED